jgi:hypothetical protein
MADSAGVSLLQLRSTEVPERAKGGKIQGFEAVDAEHGVQRGACPGGLEGALLSHACMQQPAASSRPANRGGGRACCELSPAS